MSDARQIVCPHCNTPNRVPVARLGEHPQCGRCGKPLFTGKSVALDNKTFDIHVSRSEMPLVVDFWAPWCGPCKSMAPHFEAAAAQLSPRMCLAKVDTEAFPELGARFGIRSIPTMLLFEGGKEIARQIGAMGTDHIVSWARSHAGQKK
jgi:thioredoxin 2